MHASTGEARDALLLLAGPLPPPLTGQAVAFGMLVDVLRECGVPHRVVDIAPRAAETSTPRRALQYAAILARFARAVAAPRGTVYLTLAQSRRGFARDLAMIRLARLFGHRVVAHLHGGNYDGFYAAQPPALRRLIGATLRRCERILVLGEGLRAMFGFDRRVAARVHVVPNGLPVPAPAARQQRLPAPGEGPVRLVLLSNLIESKGWLDVLDALALLRGRFGPGRVRCDFYGEFMANPADDRRVRGATHARELFGRVVAERGLGADVAWHGTVRGEAKWRALAGAHLFVLPTGYSNEGQPVSIIEAMAYGAVVVSTRYRAIPDLVQDGVTGTLVPYGDPAALAAAVAELVENPARWAAMSRAAQDRFAARFTREAHLAALLPHLLRPGEAALPVPSGDAVGV
ncbi:MAG TPA: glycosyltransferase family 4 protein [Longimicrobium sp.]|nr:glycosyltransferase family 4 protein [Longimicrobium sp.]